MFNLLRNFFLSFFSKKEIVQETQTESKKTTLPQVLSYLDNEAGPITEMVKKYAIINYQLFKEKKLLEYLNPETLEFTTVADDKVLFESSRFLINKFLANNSQATRFNVISKYVLRIYSVDTKIHEDVNGFFSQKYVAIGSSVKYIGVIKADESISITKENIKIFNKELIVISGSSMSGGLVRLNDNDTLIVEDNETGEEFSCTADSIEIIKNPVSKNI